MLLVLNMPLHKQGVLFAQYRAIVHSKPVLCSWLKTALNSVSPPVNNSPHSSVWLFHMALGVRDPLSYKLCEDLLGGSLSNATAVSKTDWTSLSVEGNPFLQAMYFPSEILVQDVFLNLNHQYFYPWWFQINSFPCGNEQWIVFWFKNCFRQKQWKFLWVVWLGFLLSLLLKHHEVCNAVCAGTFSW